MYYLSILKVSIPDTTKDFSLTVKGNASFYFSANLT